MLSNAQERAIGVITSQIEMVGDVLEQLYNECENPIDKVAQLGLSATSQIKQSMAAFPLGEEEKLEDEHWRSLIQCLSASFSIATDFDITIEQRLRLLDHAGELLSKLPERAKGALGLVMVDHWRKQVADGKRQLLQQQSPAI